MSYMESKMQEQIESLQRENVEQARLLGISAERELRLQARIAELEAQPAQSVPNGFVLVPIEPTHLMLEAIDDYSVGDADGCCCAPRLRHHDAKAIWEEMIAAAPDGGA